MISDMEERLSQSDARHIGQPRRLCWASAASLLHPDHATAGSCQSAGAMLMQLAACDSWRAAAWKASSACSCLLRLALQLTALHRAAALLRRSALGPMLRCVPLLPCYRVSLAQLQRRVRQRQWAIQHTRTSAVKQMLRSVAASLACPDIHGQKVSMATLQGRSWCQEMRILCRLSLWHCSVAMQMPAGMPSEQLSDTV